MKVQEPNVTTMRDVINKSAVQPLTVTDKPKVLANSIVSNQDLVSIKHSEYSNSENHIKRLNIGDGRQIHIGFSENDCKISARVVEKDGSSSVISKENLPTALSTITSKDMLDRFLQNASFRACTLSDGAAKLYISQKCVGGSGNGGKPNLNPPPQGPQGSITIDPKTGKQNIVIGANTTLTLTGNGQMVWSVTNPQSN